MLFYGSLYSSFQKSSPERGSEELVRIRKIIRFLVSQYFRGLD